MRTFSSCGCRAFRDRIPLDSRLRGNDENNPPVIPGEQREARNPGTLGFYPYICIPTMIAAQKQNL
jgi:hypothetical protein